MLGRIGAYLLELRETWPHRNNFEHEPCQSPRWHYSSAPKNKLLIWCSHYHRSCFLIFTFWFLRFCWAYVCSRNRWLPTYYLFWLFLVLVLPRLVEGIFSCFGLFVLCSILHTQYGCFNISILYLVSLENSLVSLSNFIRAKRVSNCYMQEKKKLTVCLSGCSDNLLVLVWKNCLGFSVGYQRAPGWF